MQKEEDDVTKGCGCLILIGLALAISVAIPFIIKLWKWAL